MIGGHIRRAPIRVTWDSIRTDIIRDVCGSSTGAFGSSPLPTSSIVRGDSEAIARLDRLIELQRSCNNTSAAACDVGATARLASLLDLRGHHDEALSLLGDGGGATDVNTQQRATLPPPVQLLREIISRHASFAARRAELQPHIEAAAGPSAHCSLPVERVDAEAVTADDFMDRFIRPGRPCVIRGASPSIPEWTPQDLSARIGRRLVPLRKFDASSAGWARLEFVGSEPFSDFVSKNFGDDGEAARGDPQLFDYSIWQSCADAIGDEVMMPKWFCTDLYSYATARVHPVSGSASPTLFLAKKGTGSALHVDFLQTHFWMALCRGRKRWRLLPREDLACLYPKYLVDLNPSFPLDLDAIATEVGQADSRYPAMRHLKVHEVVLEPGDIIFVPCGWPHQVENLETSVAISANFVDSSNQVAACRDAALLGFVGEDPLIVSQLMGDAQAHKLLQRLESARPQDHLSLREFKARLGETRTPQETRRIMLKIAVASLAAVVTLGGLLRGWLRKGGEAVSTSRAV